MAARYYVSTALTTALAANLGASGNPSVINLPGSWPTSYPFPALIEWGDSAEEAILVTSAPTGTGPYSLPCTRGIDGTTAQAHSAGAKVAHGTTGYEPTLIQENAAAIAALEAGVGGGSVTLAGDLGNTTADPQVLSTHLSAPLPENQGGTGSASQNWQGLLSPVTQTGTYTATAGQLVKANISSASWTLTLPTAPAANTIIGAKIMANASGNTHALTVACGSGDFFEQSGGGTSVTMSLPLQAAAWQYNGGYWTRLSDDLPLSQMDARYTRIYSPLSYGAAGNGSTDDTTAVQAAFAAAAAVAGIVDLGTSTFLTSSPVALSGITTGLRVRGATAFGGGTIQNRASDLFTISGSVNHVVFENCNLYSLSGGGHIWNASAANLSSGPSMSFWKILGVQAIQQNTGKAIWYQNCGGWIDCLIDQNCFFECAAGATVSPMQWLNCVGAFNSVQFKRMRVAALGSSVPFFRLDPGGGAHTDTVSISTGTPTAVSDTSAVAGDLGFNIFSTAYPGGSAQITAVTPGTGYTVGTSATSNYSGSALVGFRGWYEDILFDSITFEVCTGGGIAVTGTVDVTINQGMNWDIPGPRTDTGCSTNTATPTTVGDTAAVSGDLHSAIAGTGIPAGSYITAVAPGTGYTISQSATATNSGLSLVIGGQSASFFSFTQAATGYPCRNIQIHGGRVGGDTAGTGTYDVYCDSNTTNILLDSLGTWATPPVVSVPAGQTTIINQTVASASTNIVNQMPALSATGLTGATTSSTYAGATAGGAPASGTWTTGQWIIDTVNATIWVCTAGGTPGTWGQPGGSSFAAINDPMKIGYAATYVSPDPVGNSALVEGANSATYMRLRSGGYSMSHWAIYVGASSGNISIAAYTDSGTGGSAQPTGGQLVTSGAVACPAIGYDVVSLGSSVTPNLGDWAALSCDNATATFTVLSTGSNTNFCQGMAALQTSAHPLPSTPSSLITAFFNVLLMRGS